MSKTRSLLLLLPAAGLLAVLAPAVLDSGPELDTAGTPPNATTATAAADGAPVSVAAWGDAEVREDPAEKAAPRAAAVASTAATEGGPIVLVIDSEAGRPVAGVDVHCVDRSTARERYRSGEARGRWEPFDLPLRFGARHRTDAEGRVRLARRDEVVYVSAQHGDLFGFASIRGDDATETRLLLAADLTLRVRVTDGAGEPVAGIPVEVFRGTAWKEADDLWSGETDAAGLAEAGHFQLRWDPSEPKGERFAVALSVPLSQPVAEEFDGRSPPAEPIHLILPATGSIEVQLTDGAGTPVKCAARLVFETVRPPDFSLPLPLEGSFDHRSERKALDLEPFRFPVVGLGLEFAPRLLVAGDRRWRRGDVLRGPVRPGETARVTMPLPAEVAVLTARLVDEAGKPRAGRRLRYEITAGDARGHSGTRRTSDSGRFEVALPIGDDTGPWTLKLRLEGEGYVPAALSAPIGTLRPGLRNDLGDLVVGEAGIVATGRVVDDLGEPVENADVRLQSVGLRGNREEWSDTRLGRTRSDEKGRFELAGPAPHGRLRVRARARDHVTAHSPELSRGAEITLELTRAGVLTGSVLLPEWVPANSVSVRLRPQADPRRSTVDRLRPRKDATPFRVGRLTPGIYDAAVELRNFPEPLEEIGGIVIGPGPNEDPRLQRLDLRNHVHRYRLRAVDASGRHLTDQDGPILVRHERADGETVNVGFRWQRGSAELLATSPTIEVTVFGVGYQPRTETVGPGDHTIYMRRLQPARINLPGARELCDYGRKVRVSMVYAGDTGLPQSLSGIDQRTGRRFSYPRWELSKSNGAWLGDTDTVDVPLSRNGPHRVILRLYHEGASGNVSVPVGIADVVVDGMEPVEHTLAVDAEAIAAAIARLQARAERQAERERERGNRR